MLLAENFFHHKTNGQRRLTENLFINKGEIIPGLNVEYDFNFCYFHHNCPHSHFLEAVIMLNGARIGEGTGYDRDPEGFKKQILIILKELYFVNHRVNRDKFLHVRQVAENLVR